MAIFRLFVSIVYKLDNQPETVARESLENLAACYPDYAYIGSRASLKEFVLRCTERLKERCKKTQVSLHPLPPIIEDQKAWAGWWYGQSDWAKDSGVFPDFVIGWEKGSPLGNGALIELKDSKGGAIASFNSTLPTAKKSLQSAEPMVRDTVWRYDAPFLDTPGYPKEEERDCFYLVRTHKGIANQCRLSLVQGTFFETLPSSELLKEVWKQLFEEAGVPSEKAQDVLNYLSQLERDEVAVTRQIERASVKPRLRIMSEIHSEGNPHNYPEILPHTLNLILKPHSDDHFQEFAEHLPELIQREGIQTAFNHDQTVLEVKYEGKIIPFALRQIHHRRNGVHLVLQFVIR